MTGAPRRILLAQTSFLGDVVLAVPLHDALARAFPTAEIHWLVRPPAAELIAPLVGRERILSLDKYGKDAGFGGLIAISRRLRARQFDVGIAVQRSMRTALLLTLAGIALRIGFEDAPGWLFYHRRVKRRGEGASERLRGLAAGLGVESFATEARPRLVVDREADGRLASILTGHGIAAEASLLVVAPGAAWATKRWPAASFGALVDALVPAPFAAAILVGAAADREACRATLQASEAVTTAGAARVVDLCGRTDTAELAALVARAAVVVANDSAVGHIAAAFGRPLVSIFGPTVPAQGFTPGGPQSSVVGLELACRPCSRHGSARCPIGTHACMVDLEVSRVREAVLLAEKSRRAGQASA